MVEPKQGTGCQTQWLREYWGVYIIVWNQWETVIGSVNCVSLYTCWGSRRKRSSHGWVVYIQSHLFSKNMVIQIIYCISLFTFANFCQSLSIKSILQLLKTYSLTHMHYGTTYVFLKQIEKLFKIYTTLLILKFHLDQAQSD